MGDYLLQMEKRTEIAQAKSEQRLETAQTSLKSDLLAAQTSLKSDLHAAQVKSEERMQSNNQLIMSSVTNKALFVGLGAVVAGFTLFEGVMRVLGYELKLEKSG